MSDLPKISLYFKEGGSDKIYNASIIKSGNGFVVNFAYGRRGNPPVTGTKTANPVGLYEAERIYNKLVRSKTDKGYKVDSKATRTTNVVYSVESFETSVQQVVEQPTGRRFNFD